ncbi:MAG: hypothetical protein AAFU64_09220, partial [Bacteroidota bacterium]
MLSKPQETPQQAYFILPPELHILDLVGPVHIFYEAINYGANIQSHFLRLEQKNTSILSSAGLVFSELSYFA